ncbi:MAG: hypothetical protein QOF94_2215 [Acidobacteriaceae bacterium]
MVHLQFMKTGVNRGLCCPNVLLNAKGTRAILQTMFLTEMTLPIGSATR